MTLALTAALLGILIAGSILLLVRRGHLHGTQALWWLTVALAALGLGLFPSWVDRLGQMLAVAYPPMLLAVLAIFALLIKMVITDIELARRERRLRRLTQKLALLEYELQEVRQAQSPGAAPTATLRPGSGGSRRQTG